MKDKDTPLLIQGEWVHVKAFPLKPTCKHARKTVERSMKYQGCRGEGKIKVDCAAISQVGDVHLGSFRLEKDAPKSCKLLPFKRRRSIRAHPCTNTRAKSDSFEVANKRVLSRGPASHGYP